MKQKSFNIESRFLRVCKYCKLNITKIGLMCLMLTAFSIGCKKITETAGTNGVCPDVVSTNPVDSANGVLLTATVNATFNEAVDPSTINAQNFTLTNGAVPIAGVISYTGMTATFTPTANLLPNTKYTGTITTGVKDIAKNALINNYVWFFTTGPGPDLLPPTVTSTFPANAATNVALNIKVTAAFSKVMDSLSTTKSFTLANTSLGGTPVNGSVSYAGITAVFTPSGNLLANTTYTATISNYAKDNVGNALASAYTWSFTTGAAANLISPTVVSTVPLNAATNVALNTKVSATFSEAMDPNTMNGTTFTLKQGTTLIAGAVNYTGVTATFTPVANLLPSTTYTETISTNAKDLSGNALVNNYVWSFTTGTLPNTTPPTVLSTIPVNNATGVVLNQQVSATFSEAMDPLTISTNTFTLFNGTAAVTGVVTYSGTTAIFIPSANLISNTLYTATIKTGAKDLSGNALANNYVWSFTTLQIVSNAPVLASAANYGAFGGTAGVTNQGLNTVINNGGMGTTAAATLVTGFHDGISGAVYTETPLNVGLVTGGINTAPPAPGTATSFALAQQALADANTAYNSISPASKPGGIDPGAGELGGLTLAPGIYKSASGTFKITNGNLTLDAQGDPNAVWIFQTAAGLTVGIAGPAGARSVIMINQGLPKNVFWYVGSSATINGAGGGIMVGTIIAYGGVTFSTAGNVVQTVLNGRALSLIASVTMVNTTINVQ